MAFYDLSKEDRNSLVEKINQEITLDLQLGNTQNITSYFSDEDTYIRKTAYLAIGKIFYAKPLLQTHVFSILNELIISEDELIRQTVINAAGEVGKFHFDKIQHFMPLSFLGYKPRQELAP